MQLTKNAVAASRRSQRSCSAFQKYVCIGFGCACLVASLRFLGLLTLNAPAPKALSASAPGSAYELGHSEHFGKAAVKGKEILFMYSSKESFKSNSNFARARPLMGRLGSARVFPPSERFTVTKERGDQFDAQQENPIKQTSSEPVSTFSMDVDTASYSYARGQINGNKMPQAASIKVEEFINYFQYDGLFQPENKTVPFSPSVMVSDSPWNKGRKLMHVGIKGYDVNPASRPFCNIVFLVDVSGSMDEPRKLPLAKAAIAELVTNSLLRPDDLISIVTYSSSVSIALSPTPVGRKGTILSVLDSLQAGGGTFGEGGLRKAYEVAELNFGKDAVNRIMLVTDGDFNIGESDSSSLQKLVEKKRGSGIFLSVLGFGTGNYRDTNMKALANHGNGVAAYIDTIEEARKVMVTEASSTVFPIAKVAQSFVRLVPSPGPRILHFTSHLPPASPFLLQDVKIQVEFNPSKVAEYRLIGYEKRLLRQEDFNNDKVDAGDIGSGHTVIAIYEFTPVGSSEGLSLEPLRYGAVSDVTATKTPESKSSLISQEYAYLKIRYKLPEEAESHLLSRSISEKDHEDAQLARNADFRTPLVLQDFKFATAVAGFAQRLMGGKHMSNKSANYDEILALASQHVGADRNGYRKQFLGLIRSTKMLEQQQQQVS